MKQLGKFLRLSFPEKQLLLQAGFLLGLVKLGLLLLPFGKLRQTLAFFSQTKQNHAASIDQIVWAVKISSCYLPGGAKCLAKALTAQILMKRSGYFPELRIGVIKEKGKLQAHAWIEHEGKVAIGNLTNLSEFTLLPSLEIAKLAKLS
ncbi:MAG: lasso peptide biosynthesis B2 protein [Oscillatoria sp. PMC 1051.18]|nr:lasso peptide biosynthesis B2 protein [Oscillatoria sp. PMC 1050.18]MEC5031852.1 lasso peptide biosynthesis B2 protein [Oscillatoria sp. PMC 1051.18]